LREPSIAPEPAGAPETPRRRRLMPTAILAVLVILAVLGARNARSGKPRAADTPEIRTAVVEEKTFVKTLRFHGIVEAVESHAIAAPRLSGQGLGTMIITKLVANGRSVHQGDILVEFDRQVQLRNVLDKQAEYRDLLDQIKKKEADQAAARAADETELKQAEDAEKTAELEVKKNEIVSKIDAEKNVENLEQARATFQQLKETFDLKRTAARADLAVLEIQRDRAQSAMRWAQGNTAKMVIHSPVDGIAVINSMWKAGSLSDVQEGDEVRPGFAFLQVVNPGQMQVRVRVNQADIDQLQAAQTARVHLDAYPELSFSAKLDRIAAVAQTSAFSSKVRVFTVLFLVNGNDRKLLPDLSAAVDVELDSKSLALVVPRDTLVDDHGRTYVRVKNGSGYEKREVKPGEANDLEQVIVSGVEKGAVLLRNSSS
jgi:HlyD family secretion protein